MRMVLLVLKIIAEIEIGALGHVKDIVNDLNTIDESV